MTARVSSVELTELFLRRIERHNDTLQAFTSVLARRALKSARAMDAELASAGTRPLPTFFGVPTGIKDLVPMRGTFTTLGSRAWKYFYSPFDAPTAKLMKRGGFVVLGKLATSEFGAMPITEPDTHPPTRNPHDPDVTAGGSSGGSGAAVAADLVPIAQGSDGGGSVRIPSAFCHLYGFKPSRGLLGNLHGATNILGLSVMGPLTHTVGDAAAMLDVMRGRPLGEQTPGGRTCVAHTRERPTGLKVGMCLTSPITDVHPQIAESVKKVATVLEELGHHVEEMPSVDGTLEEFLPLWQRQISIVPAVSERLLQPVTRWLRQEGKKLDPKDVLRLRDDLSDRVLAFMGDFDMLLTPTVAVPPPRIGQYNELAPDKMFEAIAPIGAFTALFNVSGQPAASIPAGFIDGLPHAIQIVGPRDGDGAVLSLSAQLEEAMPWPRKRPAAFT